MKKIVTITQPQVEILHKMIFENCVIERKVISSYRHYNNNIKGFEISQKSFEALRSNVLQQFETISQTLTSHGSFDKVYQYKIIDRFYDEIKENLEKSLKPFKIDVGYYPDRNYICCCQILNNSVYSMTDFIEVVAKDEKLAITALKSLVTNGEIVKINIKEINNR